MKKEQYDKEDILSLLGESFHAAFRKAIPDSDTGSEIWHLIRHLMDEDWDAVLEFVYYCMEDAFRVSGE